MNKYELAMQEWLTTDGLTEPELNIITELQRVAARGEQAFMETCHFFAQVMPDTVISAVGRARQQGKCKEWPNA
ncbi:MAG: hypothetical protein K5863_08815 [Nitratireductor sp.]|uniref:hypothetical protein n=1 Tax=Nitratireductor sp. TaxID=1872084 RepID=UPI0026235C2A|nr:hypothetical protein [Nitratireductor sp.]MCV0350164.1 hypothetical protein [Nitratireductor sp.]